MAACRSWKTGNCSDWSKKKRLQEKVPETFFRTVHGVSELLWRGRQGTEWHRVALEIQQKQACPFWVFQAVSSAVCLWSVGPDLSV